MDKPAKHPLEVMGEDEIRCFLEDCPAQGSAYRFDGDAVQSWFKYLRELGLIRGHRNAMRLTKLGKEVRNILLI